MAAYRTSTCIVETGSREALPLPVTAMLLCGGQSRRMGSPKAFLPYEKSTFVESRLVSLKALFQEVIIVANTPSDYEGFGVDVVRDIIPNRGPLMGILSGLLVSQNQYSFVIACDMPLVDKKLIRQLCAARRTGKADCVVFAHGEEFEPLLAVYSQRIVLALEDYVFKGGERAKDFVAGLNPLLFRQEQPAGTLPCHFNVNTPQDYARVLGADQ